MTCSANAAARNFTVGPPRLPRSQAAEMMRFRLCSELGPAGYQDILDRNITNQPPPQGDREARYCEYRSQWTFPSSSPTLAIWTNSSSEHPRAHLSHCCFLPKSRAHAAAPANTIWPLRAFTPALMPSASLVFESEVRCRQSSKCLQMFFGLSRA